MSADLPGSSLIISDKKLHRSIFQRHTGPIGIHKNNKLSSLWMLFGFCYLVTQTNRAPDCLCFSSAACQPHLLSERDTFLPFCIPELSEKQSELLFLWQLVTVEEPFQSYWGQASCLHDVIESLL
ncbi:hypothetical protein GOODEAATRI_003831 [Goodea atripinnis]|uniref:Uncharacterized protein n=1 Tax=Goodea atripinnis TaxID=208336 RepID=A0ABV0PKL8_9TELE